jgi:hypothetical protein
VRGGLDDEAFQNASFEVGAGHDGSRYDDAGYTAPGYDAEGHGLDGGDGMPPALDFSMAGVPGENVLIYPPGEVEAAGAAAALGRDDLRDMIHRLQAHAAPPTLEDYMIPDNHPWVQRIRIRGMPWPMVVNQGPYRRFTQQDGIASYYWDPQPLASGGRYNPEDLTAAHKELPFGSIVRVTRIDNGRTVVVIINDRGPYIDGRIIDLSVAAARKLDQLHDGVAPVRVEILAYPVLETMGPRGNG